MDSNNSSSRNVSQLLSETITKISNILAIISSINNNDNDIIIIIVIKKLNNSHFHITHIIFNSNGNNNNKNINNNFPPITVIVDGMVTDRNSVGFVASIQNIPNPITINPDVRIT